MKKNIIEIIGNNNTFKMYLDYTNNFLTVDGFASHYMITHREAENVIKTGRDFMRIIELLKLIISIIFR